MKDSDNAVMLKQRSNPALSLRMGCSLLSLQGDFVAACLERQDVKQSHRIWGLDLEVGHHKDSKAEESQVEVITSLCFRRRLVCRPHSITLFGKREVTQSRIEFSAGFSRRTFRILGHR